jgi:ferritin-like metal-binding protein YciE
MATLTDRDSKLVQYLNEAYGKEKELEAALEAHIGMTTRAAYKKRLQQHLRETKDHARRVERRITQLGGDPQMLQRLAGQATAALKGPLHALRGSGEHERLLKNAKTEYSEEAEEIATYSAIEAFAESVGDGDTAKLARAIKRDEERMALSRAPDPAAGGRGGARGDPERPALERASPRLEPAILQRIALARRHTLAAAPVGLPLVALGSPRIGERR